MASPLLFAPSFRHQKLGWLFIAIVVIMVYIATFAMAAEAALSSISLSRNQGLINHLTVEIPALDDEAAIPQAERIKQAVSVLKATPDIIDVRPVPEEETTKLLEPWISEPDLLKKLPLPALIDIERRDGSNVTASELEDRLRATISDARVDDHAAWLADIAHLVGSLSVMAIFMIVLTGGALMISIALICRAVMATERDTVELLHIMGAPDRNIASHFQNHAWRLAWPAALAGFGLAVFSLALLLFFIRHVADLSGMQFARWLELALLVIAVPMAAVLAASFSAKISVVRLLRSLP